MGDVTLCACACRFGVGVSANGDMVGPAYQDSTAVICNPGNSANMASHYKILAASYAGLVASAAPGVTNLTCYQTSTQTIMTWSSTLYDGVTTNAQISLTGATNVIWAVGKENSLTPSSMPGMDSISVNLVGAPSYASTMQLTAGLVLNWNVIGGSVLEMQAVLSSVGWCVRVLACAVMCACLVCDASCVCVCVCVCLSVCVWLFTQASSQRESVMLNFALVQQAIQSILTCKGLPPKFRASSILKTGRAPVSHVRKQLKNAGGAAIADEVISIAFCHQVSSSLMRCVQCSFTVWLVFAGST